MCIPLRSPRMLKHVSRASQQLARGFGISQFQRPAESSFFSFPFSGILLCWSGGMCFYSEHFVAGVYGLLWGPATVALQRWLGTWVPR